MQALVLDFDGVLFDSARESFAVALRTYHELVPRSPLARGDERALYREFLELMPLGNGAADYGAVLGMLEQGEKPASQQAYAALRAGRDPAWLARYRERFYAIRHAWSETAADEWLALIAPYAPLVELLRRRRGTARYAIATAKDRPSVDRLLAAHALTALFPPELILDREAGPDKRAHLAALVERLELPAAELTFVDDKVTHLDSVAPLGVRCALAAWGYNGVREHSLARSRGYLVCTLEDVEPALFGDVSSLRA